MMSDDQIGFPKIPRSITNPSVKKENALDFYQPMSFILFIKTITTSFQPDTLQKYYNSYLNQWNNKQKNSSKDSRKIVVDSYRNFVRELSIKYTNLEEKKFISKLDFNNPSDLDIAIPFFTNKLIDISNYYKQKREDSKFELTRKKIRGTNFGITKDINELVLEFLENVEDRSILFDFDKIIANLEVEVEELYSYYPLYFDQTPDPNVYDNKDLDYGLDIFLRDDKDLIQEVFSGLDDTIKDIRGVTELFKNKRNLTINNISSDFYFLSTGSTKSELISGKLFDADKPINNFLNINYPTTASTDRLLFKSPRSVGFFTPNKTSILLVDGIREGFSFNVDKLEPNSLYYFPDPTIKSGNSDIIDFFVSDSSLKRNVTSGKASLEPTSSQLNSSYFGYISKIEFGEHKYLDKIFNSGYIQDSKEDVYGNLYGLFKNDGSFRSNIRGVESDTNIIKNLLLNGHLFYDDVFFEKYNYDYSILDRDTFEYIKRSGITTYTNGFSSYSGEYYIFGRFFTPYQELNRLNSQATSYHFFDGGFLMNGNVLFDDTVSSDLSSYPDGGVFYYDLLIDGGISDSDIPRRALFDPLFPSLSGNFLEEVKPDNSFTVDCGRFNTKFIHPTIQDSNYVDDVYKNTIISNETFDSNGYFERMKTNGKLFVRNGNTKQVGVIEDIIEFIDSSFNEDITEEIKNYVVSFEVFNDIIIIETENYMVFLKIGYDGEEFISTKTTSITITKNNNPFNKLSDPFKVNNDIFIVESDTLHYPLSTNSITLNYDVHKINTKTLKKTKINNNYNFVVGGGSIMFTESDKPTLKHDSRYNTFFISSLIKDQNGMFQILDFDVEAKNMMLIREEIVESNLDNFSNIFDYGYDTNLNVFLSSTPTVIDEYGTLLI